MFHHHSHHHLLHRHLGGDSHETSELKRFYASSFLHEMGMQMLSLFVLFYLYQLGWSLPVVVSYLLFLNAGQVLAAYLGSWGIVRFGVLKVFVFSNMLRILFTVALFNLSGPEAGYVPLLAVALLDALSFRTYYLTWNFYFAGLQSREKSGKQASLAWGIFAVSAALAPLASGLLAQLWGFRVSIVAAGVLLFFSVAPLLAVKQTAALRSQPDLAGSLRFRRIQAAYGRASKKNLWAYLFSTMIYNVFLYLWLLYLAVAVFADQAFGGLGLVLAASAIIALVASWMAGKAVDGGHYKRVLRGSAWIECLLSGVRVFVVNIPSAVAHNLVQQQSMAHNLLACQWYYDQGRDRLGRLSFFNMCNLIQGFAYVPALSAIIILLIVFDQAQLEVLKWSCVGLGLFSPVMLGLSLRNR